MGNEAPILEPKPIKPRLKKNTRPKRKTEKTPRSSNFKNSLALKRT
jgi:hypothetical protein